MNNTDSNARLYEKMKAEQDRYRDWLLHQEPAEILNHTYEYTMREDIVMCMEELELEPEKARALLRSPCPLSDVYLPCLKLPKEESRHIGIWGKRHLRYLKQHRKVLYSELLISGKLNDYLADLNEQAEALFSRLVKQLAEKESVTEVLKAENQMLWVQKINNIHNAAMEVVSNDLIYA